MSEDRWQKTENGHRRSEAWPSAVRGFRQLFFWLLTFHLSLFTFSAFPTYIKAILVDTLYAMLFALRPILKYFEIRKSKIQNRIIPTSKSLCPIPFAFLFLPSAFPLPTSKSSVSRHLISVIRPPSSAPCHLPLAPVIRPLTTRFEALLYKKN